MKDGVSPRITQRQRDKLTAKRLFAACAFVGLIFGLWVLSTPIHQIYWAAQARLAESKSTVFEPEFTGDQASVRASPDIYKFRLASARCQQVLV